MLSVVYQPIIQTRRQGILDTLEWRAPDGERLAEIMAKPLREQFLADGLVTREKNLLQCHPDIVEVLTRQAVAAGTFGEIVKATEAILPIGEQYTVRDRERGPVHVRKLRLGLYGGDDAAVLNWPLLTAYFGAHCPHPDVAFFMAEQWPYRGEPELAEALLPDDSARSLSLLGWARFIQGRDDEAILDFEAALKTERRRSRKRNIHIPGLAGACLVLALQRSGDPSHRELAQKQLLTAEKATVDDRFDSIFRLLSDLLSILAGEMTPGQSVWLQRDSLAIELWLDLFRCLALHWLGEKPNPRQQALLNKYCKAACVAGLS